MAVDCQSEYLQCTSVYYYPVTDTIMTLAINLNAILPAPFLFAA